MKSKKTEGVVSMGHDHRRRLERAEKGAQDVFRTLTLPSGERFRYRDEEVVPALSAAIRQQEHRLHAPVLQAERASLPSMLRLIRRLLESRARIAG